MEEVTATTEQLITVTSSPPLAAYPMNGIIPVIIIGIIGVIGNGLVLVVLLLDKKARGNQKNILILNQSLVDLLTSVDFIITYLSRAFVKSYEGAGIWWCWLVDVEVLMWSIISISTVNLMVITAERYMIVVHPVFYRNHITKKVMYGLVVSVWVSNTFINVIMTYPFAGEFNGICHYAVLMPTIMYYTLYGLFYYFLPVVMFLICHPHMIIVIRRRMRVVPMATDRQNQHAMSKKQINLTNVMISVSVVFIICWSPVSIIVFLSLGNAIQLEDIYAMYLYFSYLSFINTCINPLLYAFQYNDFKRGFRRLFLEKIDSSGAEPSQPIS